MARRAAARRERRRPEGLAGKATKAELSSARRRQLCRVEIGGRPGRQCEQAAVNYRLDGKSQRAVPWAGPFVAAPLEQLPDLPRSRAAYQTG